jgi:hypothetical protein
MIICNVPDGMSVPEELARREQPVRDAIESVQRHAARIIRRAQPASVHPRGR